MKRVRDRPGWILLAVLVTAVVAMVGAWWRLVAGPLPQLPGWAPELLRAGIWWGVLVLVLALFALACGAWCHLCRPRWEDVRGMATIVVVVAVVLAVGGCAHDPPTDWLWLQALLLLVVIVAALALVAIEWSRGGLYVVVVLVGALLCAYLVSVGAAAERESAVTGPVAAARAEVASLSDQAEEKAAATNAAAGEGLETARGTLADAISRAPADFRERGGEVLAALPAPGEAPPEKPTSAAAVMARRELRGALHLVLVLPVPEEGAAQALAVRDAAIAVVAAVPTTTAAAPSSTEVESAISCASDRSTCAADAKKAPLATRLHDVKVQVAVYRAAVSPDDEALAAAATKVEAETPTSLDLSLWSAALAGPPSIVGSVGGDDDVPLIPGPAGWVVFGVLALVLIRSLVRHNATQMPGPVDIEYSGEDKDLEAALRIAVLKNLQTPAAAPGSAVAQSFTDLAAFAGPEGSLVSKAAAALLKVVAPGDGYVVHADVLDAEEPAADDEEEPEEDDAEEGADDEVPLARVLVRVTSATSQASLAAATFEDESARQAMRSAGLWAAGLLLGRSTRVPSWASWTEATAAALGTVNDDAPDLAALEDAVRRAPTSGWLLVLYGNALELDGDPLGAIGAYARAVAAHPRYRVARYRLAVAIGMSSRDGAAAWTPTTFATRVALRRSLDQALDRLGVETDLPASMNGETLEDGLKALAAALLETIDTDATWPMRWANALRRSERAGGWLRWWQTSRPRGSATRALATSARLIYLVGDHSTLLGEVRKEAAEPTSSWQVSYNLACFHARRSETSAALDALEVCLVRPGVEQLTVEWVTTDPDLEALAASPRFVAFCARLRHQEQP